MKIFNNGTLYVQRKDLINLLIFDINMPKNLKDNLKRINLTEDNQYTFVRFTDKEEIAYYNSLPWIIDYDKYIDLTDNEILELGSKIDRKMKRITNKCINEHKKNEYLNKYKELALQLQSLRDFFWYKREFINFEVPCRDRTRTKTITN